MGRKDDAGRFARHLQKLMDDPWLFLLEDGATIGSKGLCDLPSSSVDSCTEPSARRETVGSRENSHDPRDLPPHGNEHLLVCSLMPSHTISNDEHLTYPGLINPANSEASERLLPDVLFYLVF